MDITTHNRLLNVTSLRLAMGLEIECLGYDRNEMVSKLNAHDKYSFLADKVDTEYLGDRGCEIKLPPLEIGSHYTNEFLEDFYKYLDRDWETILIMSI